MPVPADLVPVPREQVPQVGIGRGGDSRVFLGETDRPIGKISPDEPPAPPPADAAMHEAVQAAVQRRRDGQARAQDLGGRRHGQIW